MRRELVSFDFFKDYASFLLTNHLEELAKEDIQRAQKVNLPLLKHLGQLNEQELLELTKKGITQKLQEIIEGKALDAIELSMENWKADKIPGVSRDKIVASDIALIYNVKKHSLLHLIPLYTTDIKKAVDLMKEIEDYYTFQESKAIQTFAEIKKDEIGQSEKRLKEAQNLARLGCWEYDLENNTVYWSDELYQIYGLDPSNGINAETISNYIHKEDASLLMNKVKEIYKEGGSFTQEYRITDSNGKIRFLIDKGYIEKQADGKILIKGISQDITERKVALEQHDKLKALADASLDFIGLSDMEGNVVYVNEAGQKLMGLNGMEEVVRTKMVDYFSEDQRSYISNIIISHVLTEGHWESEQQFKNFKTGELIDVTWSVFIVKNETGEPMGLGCVCQDIRPRKKYEAVIKAKQAQLEEAQQIAHLGSWEWETNTNKINWSDEMYRLFGYTPGEVELDYEKYMNHIHVDDREMMTSMIANCFAHQIPYSVENRIIRKDGTVRWLYCKGKVSLTNGNKVLKLSGIAMDITLDKKKEIALKQRTADLEASNKELEAFCYTISHDLRSPLRAIDGFGLRLSNQYSKALDQEGQRLLNVVRTNAQQMGVLIDSLLEFSRLNRKEVNKSSLDMKEIINQVIVEYSQQDPYHRASFYIGEFPVSNGDRDLMKQVWHNLISNAVKFSSKVAEPRIEISSEVKDEEIIFYVKDNGTGFDMEYADKLFGVFQRLHSEDEFKGTGVGLASVQRIIHRHGGKIWAYGETGKGAVFYFTLPILPKVKEKSIYLEEKS